MTATRRRFLKLIAAGSAAAVIAPATALPAPAKKRRVAPKPAAPPREEAPPVPDEVRKLKGYVAEALRSIRAYQLEPSIEPAYVFAPLRARRRKAKTS
jgi:hypothetical protein